ncbi:hypothetical protein RINTHH_9710 [Richelia intracellularis HH01]|uniref:Uncharacterized protein n=1 Tax=Richelia intracellularis HH01 TaxID=1165094 RepID=M1X568_9NOST|nr:hypothetical protein RINTHH_9710 [Richelia intracellularis HH01]
MFIFPIHQNLSNSQRLLNIVWLSPFLTNCPKQNFVNQEKLIFSLVGSLLLL